MAESSDSGLFHEEEEFAITALQLETSDPQQTPETSKHNKSRTSNQTVKISISGQIFEVRVETLKSIPNTRLSRLASSLQTDESYREDCSDFYFDRNIAAFTDILEYYRSGELHMDQSNCGAIFKKELQFWELDVRSISMCCWTKFDSYKANSDIYLELDALFRAPPAEKITNDSGCSARVRSYIFNTLEDPTFSIGAKIFVFVSALITFGSIFAFIVESHYLFQQEKLSNGTLLPVANPYLSLESNVPECHCYFNGTLENAASEDNSEHSAHSEIDNHAEEHIDHIDSHIILHYMDYFAFSYFILEFSIRFLICYDKKTFMKSLLNIVELLCIIAHLVSLIEHTLNEDIADVHEAKHVVYIVKSLRIMRILRIFRLFRHMTGFKVLVYTIYVSLYELLLILSFLFAGVLIFASIIHYVEETTFSNIPYAIWWALVTMTTVGYGDVVPKTPLGYLTGSLCVVSGALVVAFTVPVVVNNFTLYYTLSKSRKSKLQYVKKKETLTRDALKIWKRKPNMVGVISPFSTYSTNKLQQDEA